MIAYTNDFRLMLFLSIGVLPLLLLIKPPPRTSIPVDAHTVMD